MYIEDIQVLCRRVLRGDEEASKQLGLDELQYPEPAAYNLANDSLQATYNQVLHTAAAARELDLCFFEKQCNLTLELVKAVALAKGVDLKHELDAQDVAEVMLALIHDEAQRHNYKEVPEGHSDEELRDQPTPTAGNESKTKDDQPTTTSPARSTGDGRPTAPTDEQLPSTSTVQELPSKPTKPTGDQLPAVSTAQELPNQPTKPVEEQATATPVASAPSSTTSKKNKRRQCLLCPFYGTHLERHISAKHPDAAHTKPEKVMLVHHHDKLSGSKKGKKDVRQYQCMYKKCGAIITRLGQHLNRVHKVTDKDKLKIIKKSCKRLPPSRLHQAKQKSPIKVSFKPKSPIKVSFKKARKRRRLQTSDHSSSSCSEDESFKSDGSTSNDHQEVDHHQLKVDADVDDISSFAETDEEEGTISATEQKKWADIYMEKNPNRNVRDYFMSRFYKYLLHVEGGAHSEAQGLIHARQVHTIIQTLDPEGTDLACLAKRGGVLIWDKFCVPKLREKKLSGNSIKVYLRSMEYFVKFISKGVLYKEDRLDPRHKEVIKSLRDGLPDYRSTIHRRTGHQTTTRKVDEAFARLTPADLRQVQASEPAKNAVKLIGLAAEKKALTLKEFIMVRDYLLVTTLYENGSRPGPLENCVIQRFNQATYSATNDRYTILVDKHKTTRHHGPAELTVTSRIFSYLQIYLLHVRPHFAAAGEESLFIKDDGHAFRPGTIGKRVSRFFELAGIRRDVRVTATTIRKMMSDKAYELSPSKKRLIHGHMKHNERTADANYVIKVNAERASKAHELMQNIIAETPAGPSGVPPVAEQEKKVEDVPLDKKTDEVNPAAEEDPDDDLPLKAAAKRRKLAFPSDDEKESESANQETPSSYGLPDEHKSVVLTVFQEDISRGRLLTMAEVRNRMRADLFLRKFVVQADAVKKIADFVRYKTNHTRHMQLTELDDLPQDEYVASLSIESGLRRTWNEHDTSVVEAKFNLMPHVKSKKQIISIFSGDQVLSHILHREGTDRCYEKVKTILRRKGK